MKFQHPRLEKQELTIPAKDISQAEAVAASCGGRRLPQEHHRYYQDTKVSFVFQSTVAAKKARDRLQAIGFQAHPGYDSPQVVWFDPDK